MKIKRKTLERLKMQLLVLALASTVVISAYVYFRSEVFTIRSFNLVGVEEEEAQALTESLLQSVDGYSYGIFPNNKVLSFSSSRIIEGVKSVIPDIKTIDIRPVGLHTVKVIITKHTPFFRLDDGMAVTDEGVIFNTKKDLSSYPILSVASSTRKTIKTGTLSFSQIVEVDQTLLVNVREFENKLTSVLFRVHVITIDTLGDIAFIDERGVSRVLITKDTDMKKGWATLLSAVDTNPLKSKLEESKETLEYLDIRFGNKVFYKFNSMPFQAVGAPDILENHEATPTSTPVI